MVKYHVIPDAGSETINEDRKMKLTRGAILAFSVVLHAVVFYFALSARIDIKIIDFKKDQRRNDVVLVPPPRIKFTGAPVPEQIRRPGAPSGTVIPPASGQTAQAGSTGQPGGGGVMGGRETAETGVVPPLGGIYGQFIGGSGRDEDDDIASGFSLVYPADAMLNLAKYAQEPADAWLQPLRKLARPSPSFSRYLHPRSGTREAAVAGSDRGGMAGGAPGGIGTLKSPPAGVVAAYVPENVRLFDLSGWANAVLTAVQRNWTLGADAWSAEWTGLVTIKILVMKNGERNGVDVTASSNIPLLDASARRAIDRSGPWPALPEGFPDSSLEIQMVFRYGR